MIWEYNDFKGFIVTKPTVRKAPLRFSFPIQQSTLANAEKILCMLNCLVT